MAIFGTLGENDLSAISASIADTAVDVFVYDTRKDSDGGAWRKRTQHTSWYNETLGTATRGTRREFPAVAVIVAEEYDITIYDADDPDLPMWMLLRRQSWDRFCHYSRADDTSIAYESLAALNGIVCIGSYQDESSLQVGNFLADKSEIYRGSGNLYSHGYSNGLVGDTGAGSSIYDGTGTGLGLANSIVNDVAMTVLPNAPIDPSTGLPIPTIAVATDGGVSVIKDDGSVVDIYSAQGGNYNQSKAITITEENYLWWLGDYYNGSTYVRDSYAVSLDNFPTSDFTWNNATDTMSNGTYYSLTTNNEAGEIKIGPVNTWAWNKQERNALGGPAGLAIHKPNIGSETNSLIAAITSDYNTGWMHGDIKGAFLSDTYTDADFGPEMVTGGDFSNASQWTLGTGWSINGSGQAVHTGSAGYMEQSGSFTGGKYYQLTADLVSGNGTSFGMTNRNEPGSPQPHNDSTLVDVYCVGDVGGKIYAMWKQRSSVNVNTINLYANNNVTIDNVSIKEISRFYYDRSVNNKPLALIGSLTKTPVATGADLVAYSGFSASNYLQQPYNSNLAPGTGAYSVSCWFKTGTSSEDQYIFDRNNGGGNNTSRHLLLIMHTTAGSANKFQFWHRGADGVSTNIQITDKTVTDNVWHQVVALNDGSNYKVYVDGEVSSVTGSVIKDVGNDNNPPMFVGNRHTLGSPMTGSMALFRYSLSAPSPEQIKKMYEDEKCLFQENAKATLYGSSDAVTALAFDDTTNLLHVGTSAGRSDFQGLRRINNTTDVVTTAISASNGLVAEQ